MTVYGGDIIYAADINDILDRMPVPYDLTTVSSSSTSLVDIPGSTITVAAGYTYRVEVWIAYDGPTAGDAKFAWTSSDATNITLDRNILAPATTITSNVSIADMIAIRRGTTTAQAVGTPNATANAYTVYQEMSILTAVVSGTAKMQFAQNAASGTSTVQSGYMFVSRLP